MSTTIGGGVTASDLGELLLESKITAPGARTDASSRRGVIDRAVAGPRLVALSAPPGYGKTTLLAEWASIENRMVAWVTLDAGDDDPVALLALLSRAIAPFSPLAEADVGRVWHTSAECLRHGAPRLAASLRASTLPFVLFIDDLHVAESAACQDVLEIVLRGVLDGSQAVLASRRDTPLLARLRVAGLAAEVAAADLRLDRTACRAVFDRADLLLDDDELDAVVRTTEGWPAAVSLSAQIVRADGSPSAIGGGHRYLAAYLHRECFARCSEQMQRFLRRTAILDTFSADASAAVAGEEDAEELIRQLMAGCLLVSPVDPERRWFRFHPLLREFLLADLQRAEGSRRTAELHRRSAAWLTDAGQPEAAVEHLIAAGARPEAAILIAEIALSLYDGGRLPTLHRWLDAVGDEGIQACPLLAVIAAWATALTGDVPRCERWSHIVDGLDARSLLEGHRTEFERARSMLRAARCARGSALCLADAARAVAQEPVWSPWHPVALHLAGSAHLLVGDRVAARAAFEEAVRSAHATGVADPAILSEPELALLALYEGSLPEAHAHAERGVALVDSSGMDGYPVTALALAVGARLALRSHDEQRARRLLTRGLSARLGSTYLLPFLAVRTRLQLARAHATLGDDAVVRRLMHEIDEVLAKVPDLGVLIDEVDRLRRVLESSARGGATPLTPAELRLLPYLQTHLTLAEIGDRLFVSRNTVSSQVSSIYRKLGVTTRSAAVRHAISLGLLAG